MKTKIAMLLVLVMLCACTAASAQEYYTLPEIREQAAAGWHETYTDKYGRTIPVDIEIDVFGEDVAPVLRVGWPDYVEYEVVKNDPYETLISAKKKLGGKTTYIYESYNGAEIEMDRAYGENYGNDLTPRAAFDFFGNLVEQQGISSRGYLYEHPHKFKVICSINDATGEVVAPAFYVVNLWAQKYGLPIMTHVNSAFEKQAGPISTITTTFMMRSKEEYAMYDASFVEKELLAEDIPLCSVERVIQAADKQIKAGNIQKVMSLRFGYAIYNDPDVAGERLSAWDVESWYIVPSWILECRYSANPKKNYNESVDPKLIVFNAQTGEMLDPRDTSYKGYGDSRYKGFIPWDKVQ